MLSLLASAARPSGVKLKSLFCLPSEVYENAHGKTVRDVKHHILLPHEIFGNLYRHGLLEELLFPNVDATGQHFP